MHGLNGFRRFQKLKAVAPQNKRPCDIIIALAPDLDERQLSPGGVVRRVALVMEALLMSGCARDVYVAPSNFTSAGNWKIETVTDRITGAVSPSANLLSPDASNSGEDFPKPALL